MKSTPLMQRETMLFAIGNTRLSEKEQLQKARIFCMARFDALPAELRAALRECPFDVHILKLAQHMIIDKVVSRIAQIRTVDDAMRFMEDFGTVNRGWH
jgi:hypothetical protein